MGGGGGEGGGLVAGGGSLQLVSSKHKRKCLQT